MGAWGTGLYSDDTTCDVRDDYVANLKQGLSDQESYESILRRYSSLVKDRQIACLVYFALADTAWKYGRLDDGLKAAALALIEEGGDIGVWERGAPMDVRARRRVLRSLEARLKAVQPDRKPVKLTGSKPKKIRTDAHIGSVFLLNLPSGNRAALVLVGFVELTESIDPVFTALNWRGSAAPTDQELKDATKAPLAFESYSGPRAHVGILPVDERRSVTADLIATACSVSVPMPCDLQNTIFFTSRVIARKMDEYFTGKASNLLVS